MRKYFLNALLAVTVLLFGVFSYSCFRPFSFFSYLGGNVMMTRDFGPNTVMQSVTILAPQISIQGSFVVFTPIFGSGSYSPPPSTAYYPSPVMAPPPGDMAVLPPPSGTSLVPSPYMPQPQPLPSEKTTAHATPLMPRYVAPSNKTPAPVSPENIPESPPLLTSPKQEQKEVPPPPPPVRSKKTQDFSNSIKSFFTRERQEIVIPQVPRSISPKEIVSRSTVPVVPSAPEVPSAPPAPAVPIIENIAQGFSLQNKNTVIIDFSQFLKNLDLPSAPPVLPKSVALEPQSPPLLSSESAPPSAPLPIPPAPPVPLAPPSGDQNADAPSSPLPPPPPPPLPPPPPPPPQLTASFSSVETEEEKKLKQAFETMLSEVPEVITELVQNIEIKEEIEISKVPTLQKISTAPVTLTGKTSIPYAIVQAQVQSAPTYSMTTTADDNGNWRISGGGQQLSEGFHTIDVIAFHPQNPDQKEKTPQQIVLVADPQKKQSEETVKNQISILKEKLKKTAPSAEMRSPQESIALFAYPIAKKENIMPGEVFPVTLLIQAENIAFPYSFSLGVRFMNLQENISYHDELPLKIDTSGYLTFSLEAPETTLPGLHLINFEIRQGNLSASTSTDFVILKTPTAAAAPEEKSVIPKETSLCSDWRKIVALGITLVFLIMIRFFFSRRL